MDVTCLVSHDQGKWIGAPPYCNITPMSALETPNRVLSKVIRVFFIRAQVNWGVGTRVVAMPRSRAKADGALVQRTAFYFVSGFIAEDA